MSESPLTGDTLLAAHLARRGVALGPLAGESADERENRLATALMALYRDRPDEPQGRAAFEALYALTRASVLRWIESLLRKGRHALDPAEVLQDTFVNVYRYPRGFRAQHERSFRVWVRTIAGNLIRRRASRAWRRLSFQELPEGLQEPQDLREDPRRQAEEGEELASLRRAWILFLCHYARAWESLGQRDRRTLHMVEVEGLSYQEAGRLLSVGRSNLKMIVFRSRKRIARRMRRAMREGERSWSLAAGAA